MKKDTVLKILLAVNLYTIIWDSLKTFEIIKIQHVSILSFLFSLFITIFLIVLSSHKYWILAILLQAIHSPARYFTSLYMESGGGIFYHISMRSMIFLIIGIISLLASSYFLYRLLKEQTFEFKESLGLGNHR
jgi:hypothetical protein